MNSAASIQQAPVAQVNLALGSIDIIQATGEKAVVKQGLSPVRENKASVTAKLTETASDTTSWGWLLHFPDRDFAEVYNCQNDRSSEQITSFRAYIYRGVL